MHIACGDFLFRRKIIARLFRCSCLAAKNHAVSACSLAAASTMALCRCQLFIRRGDRRIFCASFQTAAGCCACGGFCGYGRKTLLDGNGRLKRGGPESAVQDAGARFALLRFRSPALFYLRARPLMYFGGLLRCKRALIRRPAAHRV